VLRSLQDFFERHISFPRDADEEIRERPLQLATAALFIEMTRADFEVTEEELRSIESEVRATFGLDEEQAGELLALAKEETADSVELFQFTRLVDRDFTPSEKCDLVERLWRIAFADKHLDRYEEHLVRKVANLLHVPHRDFIEAKVRAKEIVSRRK